MYVSFGGEGLLPAFVGTCSADSSYCLAARCQATDVQLIFVMARRIQSPALLRGAASKLAKNPEVADGGWRRSVAHASRSVRKADAFQEVQSPSKRRAFDLAIDISFIFS
jgi:hypothetical protein